MNEDAVSFSLLEINFKLIRLSLFVFEIQPLPKCGSLKCLLKQTVYYIICWYFFKMYFGSKVRVFWVLSSCVACMENERWIWGSFRIQWFGWLIGCFRIQFGCVLSVPVFFLVEFGFNLAVHWKWNGSYETQWMQIVMWKC